MRITIGLFLVLSLSLTTLQGAPSVRLETTAVAVGNYHALAVRSDGSVWAWGDNTGGQLGQSANTTYSHFPLRVPSLTNAVAAAGGYFHSLVLLAVQGGAFTGVSRISAGLLFSMALKTNGTVWAWGDNTWGQIGNAGAGVTNVTPVQVTGLTNTTTISAGRQHGVALTGNGSAWSWGYNAYGDLGLGHTQNVATATNTVNLSNV